MDENTILVELTIDEDLRTITIPNKGMVFGVVGDIEVNRVKFILPAKYYRGFDLSEFKAKVNYVNSNGDSNYYEAENIISQDSKLFFVWLMASDVTAYSGDVKFSVTLYKTNNSFIEKRFNTRSATGRVLDGLNVETYVTPEQQQTLLQKLESEVKEDAKAYINQYAESKVSEITREFAETIDSLKEDKITKPAEAPIVGKILRVKSVNEDGTFICEWADGASDLDVQINGKSIVQNGTAEIPLCTKTKEAGLISIDTYPNNGGLYRANNATGLIRIASATNNQIDERRNQFCPIVPETIDYAVKAAICDSKGAMWTADEQTAARERMGIYDWEDILDVTLEEDGAVNLDLNGTFKDLYLYVNQNNVETPITSPTFLTPYCANNSGYFNSYYPSPGIGFKDIAAIWHYNENITYRYACVSNEQKESTGTQTAYLKVWDKNNRTDSKIYPSGAFIGLNGLTVWKAKTRIVVKGVRA